MKTEQAIEDLLKDEEIPEIEKAKKDFVLAPSEEILKKIQLKKEGKAEDGAERRTFTRAEIGELNLGLRFTNEIQFAKQYVENISIGGLFVKTSVRPEMGAVLPIEFSVPIQGKDTSRLFQLKGRVCRITDQGVGLEFFDLAEDVRADLEAFVQSVLPKGSSVLTARARQTSIDRIEQMREKKMLERAKMRSLMLKFGLMGALGIANGYLTMEVVKQEQRYHASKVQTLSLGTREVPVLDVRSIRVLNKTSVIVTLKDGTNTKIALEELQSAAPAHIQHGLDVLSSRPPKKKPRRSLTSPKITRLR